MQEYFDKIADAVYEGEDEDTADLAKQALEAGVDPEDVIKMCIRDRSEPY